MLYSMTGFGSAFFEGFGKRVQLEIRALNGKQLDINFKSPPIYRAIEPQLRKLISQKLHRGKIDAYINMTFTGEEVATFNEPLIEAYGRSLQSINDKLGLSNNNLLSVIMDLPNVLLTPDKMSDEEIQATIQLFEEALAKVVEYRTTEGATLEEDFKLRINLIVQKLEKVKELEPNRINLVRLRLQQTLDKYIQKKDIDENRLEQELVYYLDKFDITEEIVRLSSNCQLFLDTLEQSDKKKGKKLNFISQEIGREINTIGSKANDKDIQAVVVEMKDELEKIKEQLLNIV